MNHLKKTFSHVRLYLRICWKSNRKCLKTQRRSKSGGFHKRLRFNRRPASHSSVKSNRNSGTASGVPCPFPSSCTCSPPRSGDNRKPCRLTGRSAHSSVDPSVCVHRLELLVLGSVSSRRPPGRRIRSLSLVGMRGTGDRKCHGGTICSSAIVIEAIPPVVVSPFHL